MAYKTAYPTSFAECVELLGSRQSRALAGTDTAVEGFYDTTTHQSLCGIRYHSTIIARFFESGHVVLDAGGWASVSTLRKLNAALSAHRVYQYRGVWYVAPMPGTWPGYKGLDEQGREFDCGYGSRPGRPTPGKVGGTAWRGGRILLTPDGGIVSEHTPLGERDEYAAYWRR